MKKRLFLSVLAAVLLLASLAPAACATEAVSTAGSGTCGDGITWVYEDHTLTITGSGDMDDGCPWIEYKDRIEHVVFRGGVTKVGAKAFEDFDWLETVDFGDSMREIGRRAFYDCNDLSEVRLPASFRILGEECFRDCATLQRVICEGGMPSFKGGCLNTGHYVSVFYPPSNPWPAASVNQLVGSFGGMLGIMMASEEIMDQGFPEETEPEETTEAIEAAQEATVPEETAAATEAETVPAIVLVEETVPETTAAVTEPVTVPATEPETQPVQTTVPETEPVTEPVETTELVLFEDEVTEPQTTVEKVGSDGWIGMVLIAGVLTFLIVGALIFRSASRKGGRYRE